MFPRYPMLAFCLVCFGLTTRGHAQQDHGHGDQAATQVAAPTVFLDKSPRVVEYQLKRLSNEQLLMIETTPEDAKFGPVFAAILSREGMPAGDRLAALEGLIAVNDSDPVSELAHAILDVKGNDETASQILKTLSTLLLKLPPEELSKHQSALLELLDSPEAPSVATGMAALISSGASDKAFELAEQKQLLSELLSGVRIIVDPQVRSGLHARAMAALKAEQPLAVRLAAIEALGSIPAGQAETFLAVASLIEQTELRDAAIKTLLKLPVDAREPQRSAELVAWLVDFAEITPASERTQESFVDAMEFVDQLMAKLPADQAVAYRGRLRETVVRVVRLRTVAEEMRYDLPFFAVEAGRPVQVVLINEDLMPHNLVITRAGALKQVAELGLQVGPNAGLDGKQYVPNSDQVLFATNMVNAHEQEALTFDAPSEPGEYPYVCTFPRHWMRMYGVMVVVEDLDAWLKNPITPTDPVGSNREFVQQWSTQDFEGQLEIGLRGRSPEIGKRLFIEASCAQCHPAGDLKQGNVGPGLGQIVQRMQGKNLDILQEIVEPSHRIDPKYVVQMVLTEDDETIAGLVVDENDETLSLLENPEAKEPRVINKDEIAARRKTSTSMMPKGLLDRFSRDEVLEILAYILSVQEEPPK